LSTTTPHLNFVVPPRYRPEHGARLASKRRFDALHEWERVGVMRFKSRAVLIASLAVAALAAKLMMDSGRPKRAGIGTGLSASQARELLSIVQSAYASTLAAFDSSGVDASDYESRDARAAADAEALQRTLDAMQPKLAADLRETLRAFIERVASAQLQIMAFAINRKNRGWPDSAEAQAETSDLNEFKQAAEPLYSRLVGAFA